jgi:hypothetical protein
MRRKSHAIAVRNRRALDQREAIDDSAQRHRPSGVGVERGSGHAQDQPFTVVCSHQRPLPPLELRPQQGHGSSRRVPVRVELGLVPVVLL